MRGRTKNQKKLVISGVTFLEMHSEIVLENLEAGDLLFCIDVEAPFYPNDGSYAFSGYKGCFRMKVFDGKIWALLNAQEFFDQKENCFNKTEYPITCYNLCSELIKKFAGLTLYKTYRDHYTLREYQPNDFKGKKGNKFKK
jgi:hypothetical protein